MSIMLEYDSRPFSDCKWDSCMFILYLCVLDIYHNASCNFVYFSTDFNIVFTRLKITAELGFTFYF